MSKLESGRSNPSFSTISKICNGLGMTLSEFLGNIREKEPATFFININELKKAKKEHPEKGTMLPIRVFKDISVFSLRKDIKSQFAPRYTYIEKSMLGYDYNGDEKQWHTDQDDICGLELNYAVELMDLRFLKGTILLIDTSSMKLLPPGLCILDTGDGLAPSIKVFTPLKNGIAFFDPARDPRRYGADYLFSNDEFSRDYVRGQIVGVIGCIMARLD